MADYPLYGRDIIINIGGVRIASRLLEENRIQQGLTENDDRVLPHVKFTVTKTIKKEPNKCELTIFNLSKENRIFLQKSKQDVIIEAGYLANTSVIFKGSLQHARNTYSNTEWITTMQSADGSKNLKSARINKSMKGPVKVGDALREVANSMGLNPGNLLEAVKKGSLRGGLKEFTNGIVFSGKSEQQLHKLTRSMGIGFSIQDGQLMLVGPNEHIGDEIVVLSPGRGMVGSPEPGTKGVLNVRSYIQPKLLPYHRIKIESKQVDGFFRIQKATYKGDTRGQDWYVDLECKPL